MKLAPYPKQAMRWRKVVKHVFDKAERWWEPMSGDFQGWTRDWNSLRAEGALAEPDGHLVCRTSEAARAVMDRRHDDWLGAAERACVEALDTLRVYPTDDPHKVCYVGSWGVTVIVAAQKDLVTCYRAAAGSRLSAAASARRADAKARRRMPSGWTLRRAQRDAARRADLAGRARGETP